MKKLSILILLATIVACNKNAKEESKNNGVLWASNVETLLPLVRDTMWSEQNWNDVYKYDKKAIFESITKAVLAGKLKAYTMYPDGEMSINEFKARIDSWDSTHMAEDVNHPGTMISAPINNHLRADDLVQMRFNERVELDTVNYTLNKKVSFITFVKYKLTETGEVMGMAKLFDVKLNGSPEEKKESK